MVVNPACLCRRCASGKPPQPLRPTMVATEHARTRLLYGEWLRRQRRRREAHAELRAAHALLQEDRCRCVCQIGARIELLATGEKARARVPATRDQLTPQELQIALLAASGETNAAIGAQLFISANTVSHHLLNVFA